jgi:hypothetical protein
MTESEWMESNDPAAMLRLITENPDHQNFNCASDRKLRLFACTCCRVVNYASESDILSWEEVCYYHENDIPISDKQWATNWAGYPGCVVAANKRADLLRHIIGNPFRPVGAKTCLSTDAIRLAEALYEGDQSAACPLHDALLDDGEVELAGHFALVVRLARDMSAAAEVAR